MQNIKTFHCLPKLGFYNTFLMIKQFHFTVWGKKRLIAKLVRGNSYTFWSLHFFLQIAVLNENMTKFTFILNISGTCCTLVQWIIKTNWITSEQQGWCVESLSYRKRITKPPAQFWFIAWCILSTRKWGSSPRCLNTQALMLRSPLLKSTAMAVCAISLGHQVGLYSEVWSLIS